MPRPLKKRNVCALPNTSEFGPCNKSFDEETFIIMTVDEYETIRLIDYEGMNQEECSAQMHVARTTAQRIYNNARKKLAESLIEGRPFRIDGGDYIICNGRRVDKDENGYCSNCPKHRTQTKG